jgi:hypothetical protein
VTGAWAALLKGDPSAVTAKALAGYGKETLIPAGLACYAGVIRRRQFEVWSQANPWSGRLATGLPR